MGRGAHHSGTYDRISKALNRNSALNPYTVCWRCGRTLDQHPPHRTGKPQHWTTGHLDPAQGHMLTAHQHGALIVIIDGRPCAPEASRCNYSNHGNNRRRDLEPHSEHW